MDRIIKRKEQGKTFDRRYDDFPAVLSPELPDLPRNDSIRITPYHDTVTRR
jgi:hypothetical protein